MADNQLLRKYPVKRLKPVDGMAVTAEIWEEAHTYHTQQQRLHALFQHGTGIVTGLQVVASDPPDSTVYVLPGVAVSAGGDLIVVSEPVAFDLGSAAGKVVLLLSYEESKPEQEISGGPFYVHAQFGIEAAQSAALKEPEGAGGSEAGPRQGAETPKGPVGLELARIRRGPASGVRGAGSFEVRNAAKPGNPGLNEIDLRYRLSSLVGAARVSPPVSVAVCYLGEPRPGERGHGAGWLEQAVNLNAGGVKMVVDDGVPFEADRLGEYTLVNLVGTGGTSFTREQMNALYAYVRGGGTVLMESCRRGVDPQKTGAADTAFMELAASFGIAMAVPQSGAPQKDGGEMLLATPHHFAVPPVGFESEGQPTFMAGDGLLFSSWDYGCLWQGQRRGRPATREEIRTAEEWGQNLIAYAMRRRQEAAAR